MKELYQLLELIRDALGPEPPHECGSGWRWHVDGEPECCHEAWKASKRRWNHEAYQRRKAVEA